MPTLYLDLTDDGIRIYAKLEGGTDDDPAPLHEFVRPGENFGGYSYDELLHILLNGGTLDADKLKV